MGFQATASRSGSVTAGREIRCGAGGHPSGTSWWANDLPMSEDAQSQRHNGPVTTAQSQRPSQRPSHNGPVTTAQSQRPSHNGPVTTAQSQRPSHNGPVTTAQSSQLIDFFVKPVILTAQGQNTPPTVKCWRFLHFRNLKHRNLSRLILRQSVTTYPADPPPYPDHSQPACVWTSASARTALKPNEI